MTKVLDELSLQEKATIFDRYFDRTFSTIFHGSKMTAFALLYAQQKVKVSDGSEKCNLLVHVDVFVMQECGVT